MKFLNEEQLKEKVPSIFSAEASENTSEKYALIPTIDCVRGLEKHGFFPVSAQEGKCRDLEKKPYAKHLMRFRKEGLGSINGEVPEIVMVNSHNGACSYQLRAGVYRCVCSNGLIVGSDIFYRRIIHKGDIVSQLVESAIEIIELIPKAIEIADNWKGITLDGEAKRIYAESAAMLKWEGQKTENLYPKLLTPKRMQDTGDDLWTVFNVVQENLIKGGVRYYDRGIDRRNSTRPVNSVSENTRLNTALWNLTEKMAYLTK